MTANVDTEALISGTALDCRRRQRVKLGEPQKVRFLHAHAREDNKVRFTQLHPRQEAFVKEERVL